MANLGCPIKSSKEYQDFLDNFGSEELLYAAYMSNGGVVPRSFSPERNHYIDDANSKIKATSEGKEDQSTKNTPSIEEFDRINKLSNMIMNKLLLKHRPFTRKNFNKVVNDLILNDDSDIKDTTIEEIVSSIFISGINYDTINSLSDSELVELLNHYIDLLEKRKEDSADTLDALYKELNLVENFKGKSKEDIDSYSESQQKIIKKHYKALWEDNNYKSESQAMSHQYLLAKKRLDKNIQKHKDNSKSFRFNSIINKGKTSIDFIEKIPNWRELLNNKIENETQRRLDYKHKHIEENPDILKALEIRKLISAANMYSLSSKNTRKLNTEGKALKTINNIFKDFDPKKQEMASSTSADVLKAIAEDENSKYRNLAEILLQYAEHNNVSVTVLGEDYKDGSSVGKYKASIGTIRNKKGKIITNYIKTQSILIDGLSDTFYASPEELLLHEIVHSISSIVIEAEKERRGSVNIFSNYLDYLKQAIKDNTDVYGNKLSRFDIDIYGLTKESEMVSEALSNTEFRALLEVLPAQNSKQFNNAFEEFIDNFIKYILKLFKMVSTPQYENALSELEDLIYASFEAQSTMALTLEEQAEGLSKDISEYEVTYKEYTSKQQKQQAQQLYSQYLEQNPNGGIEGFKNWVKNNQSNVQYQLPQGRELEEFAASEKTIRDLAARMSDRIGIPARFESDRTKEYKGKLENGTAVVNLAYATLDTPIHEILGHPIIRALKTGGYTTEQVPNGKWEIFKNGNETDPTDLFDTKEDALSYINSKKSSLYENLLKELEYGKGKEVLDRIKRDYIIKHPSQFELDDDWENQGEAYGLENKPSNEEINRRKEKAKYTLEEQQEEAIVELLGLMTAEKLDNVKDGKLISLLKRLLKEMKAFMRELLNQKEVEIDKLPDNMTLGDIADLLAYSNSKLILPGSEVVYTTPDNQQFKTYAEASKHISDLAKNVEDVDLGDIKINLLKTAKTIEDVPNIFVIDELGLGFKKEEDIWYYTNKDGSLKTLHKGTSTKVKVRDTVAVIDAYNQYIEKQVDTIKQFIEKNKEYEQSKEIIEEWKKINNIRYNPEEVYSRGQEFVSVVGAYSDFDVNLMMQNLLQHIEDNQKAGGEFTISAFTKPVDKQISHLEGGGGKIKFKIYPQSQDIKWAANIDVYSGSVWDASEKVNKDKKSELLGVSYTKYPSLRSVNTIQPNLASIIDNLAHSHNELGISLTGNNFRLEYDEDIPYSTKKIINSINSILDQKYGEVSKKVFNKYFEEVYHWDVVDFGGNKKRTFTDVEEMLNFIKKNEKYEYLDVVEYKAKQKTIINPSQESVKKSIASVRNDLNIESEEYIHYLEEDLIKKEENLKFAQKKLDEHIVSKDFLVPRDLNTTAGRNHLYYLSQSVGNVSDWLSFEFNPKTLEYSYKGSYYDEAIPNTKLTKAELEKYIKTYNNYLHEQYDIKGGQLEIDEIKEKILQIKKNNKKYTKQALINTKIAKLKEVAKKYPRSLIRSEVKPINATVNNYGFEADELPWQKLSAKPLFQLDNSQPVKEGVDFVFEQNPELANIGTQQQYSQYLDTIFPGSKVKDIVYHNTKEQFETFDKSKLISDGFYFTPDNKAYKHAGEIKMSVLLDLKNPITDAPGLSETINKPGDTKRFSDLGHDGIIDLDGLNEYIVFEPEQIHILGSKQDIQGFKDYVNNNENNPSIESNTESTTKYQSEQQNEKQPTHPVDKINSQYSGNFKVEGTGEELSVTGYPVSKEGINSLKELEESYERQNILQRNEELEETVRPLNRYEGGTIKHKPNDPTKGTYIIDFKGDFSLFKDGSKVVSFKANISEGNATVNGNMTQSQRNDVRGVLKDRGVTEVSFEGEVIPAKQDPKGIDEHTINEQVSVLSKAMPQITNFIPDTTMSQAGVLEAGGETIRYNPLYMEHDTLGHEYGHLLIDLMGGMSNELIKRGVAQLKGTELERSILETYKDLNDTPDGKERIQKEILAQAIGKEVAKIFESEAKRSAFTRWLNRFFRNLKVSLGLERNVAKALAAKLTGGREISNKAFTGKVSNYMQEQRVVAGFQELVSPKEVSDVLINMGKPVTFEETGHTYSVTVGGETKLLDPVSTVMADNGFGDKEIVQTEALLRGQSIGTLAHATLDSVVKGVVNKVNTLNGFTLSAEAQSQLRGIVSNLIGKDDIALTEVIIPHDKAQMAGTADLIIIKPDKSIHVYDFKTKMKFGTKGEYKGFKYYSSTKFGISNKETNRLQLSLYAEMIEQATNLVVEPVLNIVPLVYTINGKTVTGIEADKVFGGKEGIIKLTRNNLAARILRSRARVNAFNKGERKIAETPDEAMSGEPLTDIESRYEALYNRIIASLNSRINTLEATGKDFDANKTKELLVALQGMESKRGVLEFLMSSRSSLDSILKVYDTHKGPIARGEGSTVITPDVIVKWHKQVMGMDSLLDDINNLLITDLYEGDPKSVSEILKAEVRSLISKKNFVRDLYKSVGKDILRDNMYMYTGKVAKTIYEDKQREWLAMDGAKRTESGFKSSEEYAQNYIETHAKEIDDNTRRAFDSELAIASKDTNSLIRWLDSMATTDDMVIGAIIKKFMILEGNARDKYLDLKEDVIIALEGLEKATGYGMSTDPVKMYDFMLERDSKGNLTGHIVDEYVSSLFEEEKEMLKMSSSMNVNERRTFRNKWYEDRFNYNKEKFNEDLTEFVDFLHAAGRISDIEYSLYTRNRSSEDNYFYKIEQLFNPEAATEFIEWIMHNKRNYYTPKEQYKNPQYAKLAAATRNASDPRTVFYNTILKIIELEQSIVPNNRQLKTQLPFDFKSSLEISKAGQSFKNIAKDQFQSGLIKREDDIDRAPLEDEAGNDINYVPLRYGRPSEWKVENQSFDLAALYLNYAKHVLDYGTRTELLSEMELATLLIENRKYTQLDPNGNPIKRLIDGFGAWAKTKEGITSNLSAMWQDWMKANIYGQRKAEEGSWDIFGTKIDRAKTYDLLNKYTAMNLLGLNVMSGIANINMGESAQIIEALTGRFITMKDLQKATNIYFRNVGGMAYSDFGNRRPTNVISALIEKWNILNDFNKESTILNNRLVNGVTDSMFITSHIGEHFMQGRLMIAMLSKVKAFDSNGKELGNMVDMYSMKDGKLTLNPEVDQNKSKWTMDKQILFGEKVKQLATAIHGEYTEVGKSAIQRYGLGRMAILFRRFIVPNVKRRYQGLSYNNLMDEFNEGTYVTTYRFLKDVITGLKNDTKTEVWARLLPREKANVLNTAYEVMFMISTALLTAFLFGKAKDTDDDDEKFWLNHMAYQAYRLNSELTFYFHPGSAAEILRSPAASQAVITSAIKFVDGIMPWNFTDKYEKGNWKGKYKWEKPLSQMAPVYRQYLRIRDVDDLNKAVNKN